MAMSFCILLFGAFMMVPANGLKCWKREDAKSDPVEATCKDGQTNCLSVTCKGDGGDETVFGGCSDGDCDDPYVKLYNDICDIFNPSNTKTCSSCSGNDLCLKIGAGSKDGGGGSKNGGVAGGAKIAWTVLVVFATLASNKLLRFHRGDTGDLLTQLIQAF